MEVEGYISYFAAARRGGYEKFDIFDNRDDDAVALYKELEASMLPPNKKKEDIMHIERLIVNKSCQGGDMLQVILRRIAEFCGNRIYVVAIAPWPDVDCDENSEQFTEGKKYYQEFLLRNGFTRLGESAFMYYAMP